MVGGVSESSHTFHAPGDVALIQHVFRDRVRYAAPMVVVEDAPERTLLYLRAGTPTRWTWINFSEGVMEEPRPHVWKATDVLEIVEPGALHSVWAMWREGGGDFLCWYVNLQDPLVRVPGGFLTCDRALDIVVGPDLRWQWKDEDHLARLVELGWVSADDAAALRAEGERVIERIERRLPPFSEPWPEWRPDPSWTVPSLPDHWDVVP